MQKLVLALLLTMLFHGLCAQEETFKRQFLLGGSIGFSQQDNLQPTTSTTTGLPGEPSGTFIISDFDDKLSRLVFAPSLAIEYSPRLIVGAQASFGSLKHELYLETYGGTIQLTTKVEQYGVGFFSRHSLNPNQKVKFFLQPYVWWRFEEQEILREDVILSEPRLAYFDIGLGTGVYYDASKRVRISLASGGLQYVTGNAKEEDSADKEKFSSLVTSFDFSNLLLALELKF